MATQNESSIGELLQAEECFIAAATVGLVPELIAGGVHADDPEVRVTVIGATLVSAWQRRGSPAEEESAVDCLLEAVECIVPGTAERLIPKFISIRVEAHDPKISGAVIWAGLGPTG